MKAILALMTGVLVCLSVCLSAGVLSAQILQPDQVRQKQEIQRKVRDMATQMVAGLLDVQLQQLEENGLERHEIYGDIRAMRQQVDILIQTEMPQVVGLLARLESSPADKQRELFLAARHKSREILVQLLTERHNLLRRLHIAKIIADVKKLIKHEERLLATTRSLPEQPPARREPLTLSGVETQRDVKRSYLKFTELLDEIRQWGGPVGAEATAGRRLLDTHRVEAHMDAARQQLERAAFAEAIGSEQAVIRGLRALLETVERVQGMLDNKAERQSVEEKVRKLVERQEEVRNQTDRADLAKPEAKKLEQQQDDIRRQIAQLAADAKQADAAKPSLEKAKTAAFEATAELLGRNQPEAMAQQDEVLKQLAEAAKKLDSEAAADATPEDTAPKDADADKLIADLEATRDDLKRIAQQQQKATEATKSDPAEARKQETEVAQQLAKVPEKRQLPAAVKTGVEEAQAEAARAASRMNQPEQQRRQAAERAQQAIDRARSETESALADAKREQIQQQLAEQSQAARALDRAARAERQVAQEAREAAESDGLQPEQARQLAKQQARVEQIAAKVAEGIRRSTPQAAEKTDQAREAARRAGEQLETARQQPGEPSKQPAAEAAKQADQAAGKLAEAADQLRREAAKTAQELAELSRQQRQQANQARQAVEDALANRPEIGQRIDRLEQARRQVQQAEAEQHRAAGRPEAARAKALAESIRQTIERQDEADRAERRSEAIAKQNEVAKAAENLSKQQAARAEVPSHPTPAAQESRPEANAQESRPEANAQESRPVPGASSPPIADALRQGAEAARRAARDMLDGNPREAQAAAAETRQALNRALEQAKAQAEQAAAQPAGQPDVAAQQRVGQAVEEARQLAEPDAPEAAGTLQQAARNSAEAQRRAGTQSREAMTPENREATTRAQQSTAQALGQAAEQLARARQQLAQQAAEELARQAQQSRQLAEQALPVDPGATAALQTAERRAEQGSRQVPQSDARAAPAERGVGEAMRRALANLNARQQQLARDEAAGQQSAEQPGGEPSRDPSGGPGEMSNESISQAMQLAAGLELPSDSPQNGEAAEQSPSSAPSAQGATRSKATATVDQNKNARAAGRQLDEAPWLLDLPPEMRSAIRANSTRRPPRGYEQRLRRYFENVD